MMGRHIWTATLADGRVGMFLRTTTLLLMSLAVALMLATFAMGQETTDQAKTAVEAARNAPITLVVDNQNWSDMRIYAIQAGQRIRIGTAYTHRTTEIEIPASIQADVRGLELVAQPIGGKRLHRSGTVLVSPGDVVHWTLQNGPAFSSILLG